MVKPGGTGRPSTDVISARVAPFPPSRSFICMGGLRCLWSKAKTNGMDAPGASGVNSQRAYRRDEGGRDLRPPSLQGDLSRSCEIPADPVEQESHVFTRLSSCRGPCS